MPLRPALLLLLLHGAAAAVDPDYVLPPTAYATLCHRMTQVYDIKVCVEKSAWDHTESTASRGEVKHVVNALAQFLDNNEDGKVDDVKVVDKMRADNSVVRIATGACGSAEGAPIGRYTCIKTDDVHPTSCDLHAQRGADRAVRSTWAGRRDVVLGCSSSRDMTYEVLFTLMYEAAARVYPAKWGKTWSSEFGRQLQHANGNCGWADTKDYVDPSTTACKGYVANNDADCKVCSGCIHAKGLYYATATYVGGVYTSQRYEATKGEWTMQTPDVGMDAAGASQVFETAAASMYRFVSETKIDGHAWLPEYMPDGNYAAAETNLAFPKPVYIDGLTAPQANVNDDAACFKAAPTASDDDLSGGAIAGIVVGVVLGAAIIGAGIGMAASGGGAPAPESTEPEAGA